MKKTAMMVAAIIMSLTLVGCGNNAVEDISATVEYVDYDGTVLQTEDYDVEADLSGVTAPTNPERVGYTFDSWSGVLPLTMGEETVTLTATYTINQYTVEYVDYEGTILQTEDYDFGVDLSGVTTPTDPVRVGYTFDSWSGTVPATMGTETVTLTAVYTINQQIVQYVDHDGTVLQIEDYDFGADLSGVIAPTDPVRVGYTFDGWSATVPVTMGTDPVTITATYTIHQYTINYNLDGGSNNMGNVSTYNIENKTITLLPAKKTEATFLGWYDNIGLKGLLVTTIPSGSYENITLYAGWAMNQYTVEYVDHDGTVLQTADYDFASDLSGVTAPVDPERDGYTFDSWSGTVPATMGSSKVTITATYTINQYSISYYLDGGIENVGRNVYSYNIEDNTFAILTPTKEEATFLGWYDTSDFSGEVVTEIPIGSYGDITLYAKWDVNEYITTNIRVDSSYDPTNQINLAVGETITSVSLGTLHSAVVTSESRIFTWGDNSSGQLGDGTTIDRITPTEITWRFSLAIGEIITSVSLGQNYSSALTSEGRVFIWGANTYGQLGDGTNTDKTTPTEITNHFNLAIGERITSISLGALHSSAVTSEGRIFTWGWNDYGQLGDGTSVDKNTPTEITAQFNLAIGEKMTSTSMGVTFSSALTSEGRVFTWGDNDGGYLGNGTYISSLSPIDITSQFNLTIGEIITNMSLGHLHASALTSNGRIFMWGFNRDGEVGDGTTTSKVTPLNITSQFNLAIGETITSISLGFNHSSAVTSDGRIFTWGANLSGQLGDGTTTIKVTPLNITSQFNLAIGETITSTTLNRYRSSVLTSNGRIFTWGDNEVGQLGDEDAPFDKYAPTDITYHFYYIYAYEIITYEYDTELTNEFISYVGYTFVGWYTDSGLTHPYTGTLMPNYPLYALYIKD